MNMNNINLVTDETNTVSDLLKKKNIIQNTNTDMNTDINMDKMENGFYLTNNKFEHNKIVQRLLYVYFFYLNLR